MIFKIVRGTKLIFIILYVIKNATTSSGLVHGMFGSETWSSALLWCVCSYTHACDSQRKELKRFPVEKDVKEPFSTAFAE